MPALLRYFIGTLAFCLLVSGVRAQRFSDDKDEFRAQAISRLQAVGTEPAKKIAFDFKNAWDGKFTSLQQDRVHQIALKMQKKGYQFYPYFYHYFTYLAYSVAQENLQRDKLNKVLEINEQVLETMPKSEYREFLFGLNIFFARRYLSLDKNLVVQATEGTYTFNLLDEFVASPEEEEVQAVEEDLTETTESDTQESGWSTADSWSSSNESSESSEDDWGSSAWGGSDDSWDNNDDGGWGDSWDTDEDGWGSSDDSWDSNTDSWGTDSFESSTNEIVKPERPLYTPIVQDHLALRKNRYNPPAREGPAIELISSLVLMATPFDSLRIKSVNGSYLLKDRTLVGKQGSIVWPGRNKNFRGATIQLEDFHIEKDRPDFWTPNAKLQYAELFGADAIEGTFEFKSTPRPKRQLNQYPIFTSNNAGISVKLKDEKVSYKGGIQLRGNRLIGKSISREDGVLSILDGRGNTVQLKSQEIVLGDTLMFMNNGSATIFHGNDSIYHNSVKAKYDLNTRELKILRLTDTKPYRSTYFDISLNVDLITWNMERDSIAVEIMDAKDLLPATFESEDFFDNIRYKKMGNFLDFHPLNATVYYAQKYDLTEFYVGELALEYEIDENYAKAAGKILSQYGFADYDQSSGFLKLYPKAFHYYNSSAQRVDYDNLMLPSKIKNGANGFIRLDSGQLKVKGVHRFYLTSDYKIFAEPEDSTVTILEGRNLEFDGMVHAGDFQYKGKAHEFDYKEFLFNMPSIDSMRLTVPLRDSTDSESEYETATLNNEITGTSGTLYLADPSNKSGKYRNTRYPYFNSDSDAVVYFDGEEILDGAYDKSVRFIIPPFEMDSLERSDGESISFEGTFNSGGIFPSFEETLHVQEDRSLGFVHQIPEEGYNLYGTEATTYNEIRLSNQGMRGYGQIDFLTTTIYSDDFIYYPDSVTSDGTSGLISPGTYKGASFPEATLGEFDMYWLPRKDSMYLNTVGDPFEFYNSTATLEGFANITTGGVYGGGTMLTRGSKSTSKELSFKEFEYSARHASFEVLSDIPDKPAMAGEDIRLDFDLTTNTATVKPEQSGVAAISFPYAQMKTSITSAVWDLKDSVVTMTKPANVDINDSYFFSTREELDSLVFNGEKAIYDINSQELNVQGIPFIVVADSKIIPEGNETTILANSVLEEFNNSEIIIDTLNGYHYLDRANIRILSRNKFEGNAYYKQIVESDTFDIRFDSFELQEVPVGEPDRRGNFATKLMTVSGGEVLESQNVIISNGFLYKGSVTMYASKPSLDLDGFVKLNFQDPEYDEWVQFKRTEEERKVRLRIDDATFDGGQRVNVGLHSNKIRDDLYYTFVEKKASSEDADIYTASGVLFYDDSTKNYVIETPSKTDGSSFGGHTMIYNEQSQNVIFEGPIDFISAGNTQLNIRSSILGVGNRESGEVSGDCMLSINLSDAPNTAMVEMASDLTDIIQRIGPPLANKIEVGLLNKLANTTYEKVAQEYEQKSLKEYVPLVEVDRELEKTIFISGVKMKWDQSLHAWHNTSRIGVSHITRDDINAKLDGFLEIKKDETGADIFNLFIQAAPGIWYYIGYSTNQLIMYSSNEKFNETIQSKSNVDKAKPEELVLAVGTVNETLSFINDFRLNYFGIKEPYNLISPDDINVEDENLDTIEEDDDDGFGFE